MSALAIVAHVVIALFALIGIVAIVSAAVEEQRKATRSVPTVVILYALAVVLAYAFWTVI